MFHHSFLCFLLSPFPLFFKSFIFFPVFQFGQKGGGWPEYISLIFFVTSDLPSSLRHCLTYLLNLPPYLLPTFRFFTPSVDLPFSLLSVSAPLITIFSCLLYFFFIIHSAFLSLLRIFSPTFSSFLPPRLPYYRRYLF